VQLVYLLAMAAAFDVSKRRRDCATSGDEAVLPFRKRLQACIKAAGGHFEHAL